MTSATLAVPSADPASSTPPPQALHLLNALYAFYQHERSWVHRTRASLELALVQGPLAFDPPPHPADGDDVDMADSEGVKKEEEGEEDVDGMDGKQEEGDELHADEETPSSNSSDADGTNSNEPSAAVSDISSSSISSMATTASTSSSSTSITSVSSTSSDPSASDIKIKPEPTSPPLPPAGSSRISKSTRRNALTIVQPTPDSRWHRRKKSFKLSLGSLTSKPPQRPRLVLPLRPSASGNQPPLSSSSPAAMPPPQSIPLPSSSISSCCPSSLSPSSYHPYSYPHHHSHHTNYHHHSQYSQQQHPPHPHPPHPTPSSNTSATTMEVEPSTQLLQLFGELVESRLESCVRVSRLLQEAPPPSSAPTMGGLMRPTTMPMSVPVVGSGRQLGW